MLRVLESELVQVKPKLKNALRKLLEECEEFKIEGNTLICQTCENWELAGLKSAPNYRFEIHGNIKQKMIEHRTTGKNHLACKDGARDNAVMRKLMMNERTKLERATENLILLEYFTMKFDLPTHLYEQLVNALCNAIVGNWLHLIMVIVLMSGLLPISLKEQYVVIVGISM